MSVTDVVQMGKVRQVWQQWVPY